MIPQRGMTPRDFPEQGLHNGTGDIESSVIKGAAVCLDTAVIIMGIKQQNVPAADCIFRILTGEAPGSGFDETDDIVVVKMIRKWLHDAFKAVCLKGQIVVMADRPDFFSHGKTPPSRPHYIPGKQKFLVRYLHPVG